jgi:hypothetical protein
LKAHQIGLALYFSQRFVSRIDAAPADPDQQTRKESDKSCDDERPSINKVFVSFFCLGFGGFGLALWVSEHVNEKRRVLRALLIGLGLLCPECGLLFLFCWGIYPYTWGLPPHLLPEQWRTCRKSQNQQPFPHTKNVSQKCLRLHVLPYYNNYMANVLSIDKQIAVISSLCEGSSTVYAWTHATDDPKNPKRHVTVLRIPPVISPKTAVQAVIVHEFREHGKAN